MKITIPGKPIAWQRMGAVRQKNGSMRFFDQQAAARKAWRLEAAFQIKGGMLQGPLRAWLFYAFEIPKSKKKTIKPGEFYYPTGRHDIDNLTKWVFDCLEGLAFKNDSQIVEIGYAKKLYWTENLTEVSLREVFG